jgi:hypothetical protein
VSRCEEIYSVGRNQILKETTVDASVASGYLLCDGRIAETIMFMQLRKLV